MAMSFRGGMLAGTVASVMGFGGPQVIDGFSTVAGCPIPFGDTFGPLVEKAESASPFDLKSAIVNQQNLQALTPRIQAAVDWAMRKAGAQGCGAGLAADNSPAPVRTQSPSRPIADDTPPVIHVHAQPARIWR